MCICFIVFVVVVIIVGIAVSVVGTALFAVGVVTVAFVADNLTAFNSMLLRNADLFYKILNFSDFGFREVETWFGSYCGHDSNYVDFAKHKPDFCRPGLLFNISKG